MRPTAPKTPRTSPGLIRCTVVLEFNYGEPRSSMGSVWLYNGDGTQDLEGSAPLASLAGWVRVIGPVDLELARRVHSSLTQFLAQNGVAVIDEGVAD